MSRQENKLFKNLQIWGAILSLHVNVFVYRLLKIVDNEQEKVIMFYNELNGLE